MNILALDIATKCGYCTRFNSGVIDFSKKRNESSYITHYKFNNFIRKIIVDYDVDIIAVEKQIFVHKFTLLHELHGILKLAIDEENLLRDLNRKIVVVSYAPSSIKKFITGSGNAGKDKMIDRIEKLINKKVVDDNEADAIGIYLKAHNEYNKNQ